MLYLIAFPDVQPNNQWGDAVNGFIQELKRRSVFRVGAAYLVSAWLVLQVVEVVTSLVTLPEWLGRVILLVLAAGLPVALVVSWAFELTPEGIKKESDVDRTSSTTSVTGRRLDFVIIGVLIVCIALLLVDKFLWTETDPWGGRSIAILPFENMSGSVENEPFTIGIHDDLLTQVSKIGSIKTISRTSVLQYRGTTKSLPEIARELGAATVLEGGVQRAGQRVRINAQLIDARTDEHVWAETFNRELTATNIFAIQSEIAREIASALRARLSSEEAHALESIPTRNLQAYDLYVSGKDFFHRGFSIEASPVALKLFERALEVDPDFALAHVFRARTLLRAFWFQFDSDPSQVADALVSIERAFELEPGMPEAHLAMGYYHYYGFRDYERALVEFALAEQGMPGNAEVLKARAYVARRLGKWEESVSGLARAIELDPRNADAIEEQAATQTYLRNYEEARRHYDRALAVAPDELESAMKKIFLPMYRDGDATELRRVADEPPSQIAEFAPLIGWIAAFYQRDYEDALGYLDRLAIDVISQQDSYMHKDALYGYTYEVLGRAEQAREHYLLARAHLEPLLAAEPDEPAFADALAGVLSGLKEHDRAVALARRATELMPASKDAMSSTNYRLNLAWTYLLAGDPDAAFARFDDYLSNPGQWSIEGLIIDPRFDSFREDPRYLALLDKHRRGPD